MDNMDNNDVTNKIDPNGINLNLNLKINAHPDLSFDKKIEISKKNKGIDLDLSLFSQDVNLDLSLAMPEFNLDEGTSTQTSKQMNKKSYKNKYANTYRQKHRQFLRIKNNEYYAKNKEQILEKRKEKRKQLKEQKIR
jgi:hypothetical protein